MKNYAKDAFGYVLKAPRMVRVPKLPRVPRLPDMSREKRMGMLALVSLGVVFAGVLIYRLGNPGAETPAPGQTLALAGDTDTIPSPPGTTNTSATSGTKSRFAAPTSGAFASSAAASSPAKTPIMPAAATTTSNDRYADYRTGGVALAGDTPQKAPATLPQTPSATALASDSNPLRSSSTGPTPSLSGTVTPLGGASVSTRSDARILPTSGTAPVAGSTPPTPSAATPTTTTPSTIAPSATPPVTGSLPSGLSGSSVTTPSVTPSATPSGTLPSGLSGSTPPANPSSSTMPAAAPLSGNSLPPGTAASPAAFGTAPTNRPAIRSSTSSAAPLGNNPYGGNVGGLNSAPPGNVTNNLGSSTPLSPTTTQLPTNTPSPASNADRYGRPTPSNGPSVSPSNGVPTGSIPGSPSSPTNFGTPPATFSPTSTATPGTIAPGTVTPGTMPVGQPSGSFNNNPQPYGNNPTRGSLPSNPYGTQQPGQVAPGGFQNSNPLAPTSGFNPPPTANQPLVNPGTVTLRDGRTIKVRVYKVREGDTLFDIARYQLGKASRWSEIFQINQPRLGDMLDHLSPGMDILIPDTSGAPGPQGNQFSPRTGEREPLTTSRSSAIPR